MSWKIKEKETNSACLLQVQIMGAYLYACNEIKVQILVAYLYACNEMDKYILNKNENNITYFIT